MCTFDLVCKMFPPLVLGISSTDASSIGVDFIWIHFSFDMDVSSTTESLLRSSAQSFSYFELVFPISK